MSNYKRWFQLQSDNYMKSLKKIEELDKVFEFESVKICIDKKSYLFLNGMEIDYEETPFKSGITLNVPNVTRTCGCGESVAF